MSEERRANPNRVNPNPLDIGGVLAILYTIAYMAMVTLLFFKSIPPENKDLINTLVGIMSAVQMAIIQWVFGSSKQAESTARAIEQRQGRAEAVVQEIAKTVPIAAAAAALQDPPSSGIKADHVNIDADTATLTEKGKP